MNEREIELLAAKLGERLLAHRWRVATAESCTGGLVAGAITAIAGSSDWFDRGFVTYSNGAKRALLDVAESVLLAYGAVSESTAIAMAEGALQRSDAALTVAITGIAGPGGGTPEKPVGMVCFAWSRGGEVRSETRHFPGDRESVRRQSVILALEGVLRTLEGA